jgi:hypothetical protein
MRAKNIERQQTLLWIYYDLVVSKGYAPATATFKRACMLYGQLPGLPPVSAFAVNENHFVSGPGRGLVGLNSGIPAPGGPYPKARSQSASQVPQAHAEMDYTAEGDAVYQV